MPGETSQRHLQLKGFAKFQRNNPVSTHLCADDRTRVALDLRRRKDLVEQLTARFYSACPGASLPSPSARDAEVDTVGFPACKLMLVVALLQHSDKFEVHKFHHIEFWAADATSSAKRCTCPGLEC